MFTGLVEEIGRIEEVERHDRGIDLRIAASVVLDDLKVDHSIAVDGCCQTVTSITEGDFSVTVIPETIRKTTLGSFEPGRSVNLERALRIGDRLGGHLVQGHIDTTGEVLNVETDGEDRLYTVGFDPEYDPLVIPVGSIVINGVSLTVARRGEGQVTVAVIPHTWNVTTFYTLGTGHHVNLEFDMIGKYIRNLLR